MPAVPGLRRLRQEDHELDTTLIDSEVYLTKTRTTANLQKRRPRIGNTIGAMHMRNRRPNGSIIHALIVIS